MEESNLARAVVAFSLVVVAVAACTPAEVKAARRAEAQRMKDQCRSRLQEGTQFAYLRDPGPPPHTRIDGKWRCQSPGENGFTIITFVTTGNHVSWVASAYAGASSGEGRVEGDRLVLAPPGGAGFMELRIAGGRLATGTNVGRDANDQCQEVQVSCTHW
jgi:hypothetical protein